VLGQCHPTLAGRSIGYRAGENVKAIIVDSNTDVIDGPLRQELLSWAQGLGVDTKRATAMFVLVETGRQEWSAVFSLKRQRDNHDYIDPNTGRLAVDYGCARYSVAEGSWPRWFGIPLELPEMRAGHLLDVLAAARDAASALREAVWYIANQGGVAE
jgi:uncharacterized membrane-anchored protein